MNPVQFVMLTMGAAPPPSMQGFADRPSADAAILAVVPTYDPDAYVMGVQIATATGWVSLVAAEP